MYLKSTYIYIYINIIKIKKILNCDSTQIQDHLLSKKLWNHN